MTHHLPLHYCHHHHHHFESEKNVITKLIKKKHYRQCRQEISKIKCQDDDDRKDITETWKITSEMWERFHDNIHRRRTNQVKFLEVEKDEEMAFLAVSP